MMNTTLHLVRHGEVENPDHVVYADLPEFRLSSIGEVQAEEAAACLADRPISAVCASPLTRAVQTARTIAGPHGLEIEIVEGLTEFGLSKRWRGVRWEELNTHFPGELDAYLAHPWDLPFSPESLEQMTNRMEATIRNRAAAHPDGDLVVVSHQDPVQAARFRLTGRGYVSFGNDKPDHAEVITLEPGTPWREVSRWRPTTTGVTFPPPAKDLEV